MNAIADGNARGFELFHRARDSPIGQAMAGVVVEADDKHPRMMTNCCHDQVVQVFEVLIIPGRYWEGLGDGPDKYPGIGGG